jgi:hypothetical protein
MACDILKVPGKRLKLFLFLIPLALLCGAQTSSSPRIIRTVPSETTRDPKLELAISRELGDSRYSFAYNRVKLRNRNTPEVLVYLPGRDYCGSGGCTLLIFEVTDESRGGDYRLISRISLIRSPIIVSSHRTNGWNDLIVLVSGGGRQPGYYAVLSFNGGKYPENPTTQPAVPLRPGASGVAYLSGSDEPGSGIVVSPR